MRQSSARFSAVALVPMPAKQRRHPAFASRSLSTPDQNDGGSQANRPIEIDLDCLRADDIMSSSLHLAGSDRAGADSWNKTSLLNTSMRFSKTNISSKL